MNTQIQKTFDQVIDDLTYFILEVKFTKLDGTERNMICTLNKEFIPNWNYSFVRRRNRSAGTIPVFDVEKMEWRSFKYDSIQSINAYVRV